MSVDLDESFDSIVHPNHAIVSNTSQKPKYFKEPDTKNSVPIQAQSQQLVSCLNYDASSSDDVFNIKWKFKFISQLQSSRWRCSVDIVYMTPNFLHYLLNIRLDCFNFLVLFFLVSNIVFHTWRLRQPIRGKLLDQTLLNFVFSSLSGECKIRTELLFFFNFVLNDFNLLFVKEKELSLCSLRPLARLIFVLRVRINQTSIRTLLSIV